MRPTPDHRHSDDDSGRIIYLGDVRRKRTGRSRKSDGQYLAALAGVAILAFGVWVYVLLKIAPSRLLTYSAFFAPLWLALASTASLVAYWVEWRRGEAPIVRTSVRRGVLTASVPVFNLAAGAAHEWSLPVFAVSLLAAVVIEVAVGRRQDSA